MSSVPKCATVAFAHASADCGSEMSVGTKSASHCPSSCFMARSARSSLSSATTTFAPSPRNRSAYARPIPWPAPVMIATLSCRRPTVPPVRGRLDAFRLRPVDEVEALGDDRLAGRVVAPHRLHDDEGHRAALALALVHVGDLALAHQHVAHDDRAVVLELLLAVQHQPALGEELAHHLVHRVLATGGIGWLMLSATAHVVHRGRERRRGGGARAV